MTKLIQFTGEIEIEDHEYDPGDEGPLTEEAFAKYNRKFRNFKRRFYIALDDNGMEVSEPRSSRNPSHKKKLERSDIPGAVVVSEPVDEPADGEAAEPEKVTPKAPKKKAASKPEPAEVLEVADMTDEELAALRASEEASAAYEAEIATLGDPEPEPVEEAPEPVAAPEEPTEAPLAAPAQSAETTPPPAPVPNLNPAPAGMPSPGQMFAAPAPAPANDNGHSDDPVPF